MRILFLGPAGSPLVAPIEALGDEVTATMDRIDAGFLDALDPGFLVSCGYRRILPEAILGRFGGRAINLHIAYLPWNRGADPNLWSFVDRTPKGVTIHRLDAGVDTGEILAQREVAFPPGGTLRTTYDRLQEEIRDLFREHWPAIREGRRAGVRQPPGGSFHRLRDKEVLAALLARGWDTPVADLEAYGERRRAERGRG